MEKLTIVTHTVRYRIDDVHDGEIPRDNVVTKTREFDSARQASAWLDTEGLTEYSQWPVPSEPSDHGWWSSPDGDRHVYGGDEYDPGYDREEISAHVQGGRGAYALHCYMRAPVKVDPYRRSPDPVIGGYVADGWDSYDPYGSAMEAFFAIAEILYVMGEEIPREWGFTAGLGLAECTIDDFADDDSGHLRMMLADEVRNGTIKASDLLKAGRIIRKYIDIVIPEDRKY
jgi:hypothetical protein